MIKRKQIRRRRKKNNADPPPLDTSNLPPDLVSRPTSTESKNPYKSLRKPNLSDVYLREEQDIKQALTKLLFNRKSRQELDIDEDSANSSKRLQRELDFFTNGLRENFLTDEEQVENNQMVNSSAEDRAVSEGTDGQLMMASSFVLIEDDLVVEMYKPTLVEKPDSDLFIGNSKIEDNNDDILEESRNLEDEGLFVHQRTFRVGEPNERFLIERLLLANRKDCVRMKDGQRLLVGLRQSDDGTGGVYRSTCAKEYLPIHYEPRPQEEAISKPNSLRPKSELHLFLESIDWANKYDVSLEKQLTQTIEMLHSEYQSYNQINDLGRLVQRLKSIRNLLNQFDEIPAEADLDQVIFDRRDLRNKIHRENQCMRDNVIAILDKWVQLKELRKKQGFASTDLKLVIRTTATDMEEDQKRWDLDFNVELNEVLEEAIQFYNRSRRLRNSLGDGDVLENETKKPNPEEIEDMLHDIFMRSRRHPGEPIVRLELEHQKIGSMKKAHSSIAEGQNITIRVLVDQVKKVVLRKVTCVDSKDFLNVDVKLLVDSHADGCHVVITQDKPASQIKLHLPLPEFHEDYKSAQMNAVNFTSNSNQSGTIRMKLGWTNVDCANKCSFGKSKPSSGKPLQPEVVKILKNWYDECTMDPLDPDTASLVKLLPGPTSVSNPSDRSSATSKEGLFRLNEDLTAFCSKATILNDKRLNLLTSRFNSHLKQKDERNVPATSRELSVDSILPDADRIIADLDGMDPIDTQRHEGNKRLLHIYKTISNHCEWLNKHSDSHDLLIGNEVPTLSSFVAAILQIFVSKRPLNPQRTRSVLPHQQTMRSVTFGGRQTTTSFKLIVNVIRAQGVPLRNGGGVESGEMVRRLSATSIGFANRGSLVMPYVVVAFRDQSCRTSTAEGPNPTWNEQLVIPISGYSNLDSIKDSLDIQLFDEQVENLLDEDRSQANEIYQRISSRWLADIRIPFYTILSSPRLEGTFEMSTPPVLLGYSQPIISIQSDGTSPVTEIRNSSHLTLFIHLEPALANDGVLNTGNLECSELPNVVSRAENWLTEFREEFPQRSVNPLVALSNGKRVCVTRLIGAVDIPCERSNVSEFLVRRFVGLLPIVRSGGDCSRLDGVWLTNEQSLSMLSASAKDLGTILVGFYLSLGFRAYLVLGFALPHGDTTFVLTKENGEYFLIDPTTGRKYSANDTRCPLQRVYALATSQNVWANIQRESRVFMMHFNVAQSSEWHPLFGRSCGAPVGLVHNPDMVYRSSDEVFDLRKAIEWKLMKKMSAWRPHRKTTWNRSISETLRQVLVELEEDVCYEYEHDGENSYVRKLNEFTDVYHLSGMPLNMRYISMANVVKRLKSTGVHLNPNSRVEFGLAIHIQAYPCNVLSLWVFVVAMVPKV